MFGIGNNKNEKNVFTRFLPEFEHKENLMNKAAASKYVSRFLELLLGCINTVKLPKLEPLYFYCVSKKVPDQFLVWGIGDLWRFWMILNLSLNDSLNPIQQFGIIQNFQRLPIPQTSNFSGTVFGYTVLKTWDLNYWINFHQSEINWK